MVHVLPRYIQDQNRVTDQVSAALSRETVQAQYSSAKFSYNCETGGTLVDTTHDTQPLSALQQDSDLLLQQLKATHRPITLTVNGQPEFVLQEAAAYQQLLDRLKELDEEEGLRRGLEDVAAGRIRPAAEVFEELRMKYGIQR